MSSVVPIDRDPHSATLALLAWYARGQLDDAEMREVQSHLQTCPRCQAELAAEPALSSLYKLPLAISAGSSVEAGLARMRARLPAAETLRPLSSHAPTAGSPSWPGWLAWVLGLQGGAIAALVLLLVWTRAELPAYRGLSAPGPAPAASAQALIMFRPEASEVQIRAALQAAGASLAGGPTQSGAYVLHLPSDGAQRALQGLRAASVVTMAESLESGAAP